VFQYACKYITLETENILKNNDVLLNDLNYFIPHQANARITDFVAKKLKLDDSQVLSNIDRFGNTGCASTPIVLAQNLDKLKPNDTIVLSVFGGGYSSGAVLLRKL
jgi:3-oxoacyl-[acyl-carrier-protein] synthase-3